MRFTLSLIIFLQIASAGIAQEVTYMLSMPEPQSHYFQVEMVIKKVSSEDLEVYLPVWTPGSYKVRDFSKNFDRVHAFEGQNEVSIEKINKNSWKIEGVKNKSIRIKYQVYAYELSVRTSFLDATHGYVNGASIFLTARGLEKEPIRLEILPFDGWENISTGMKEVRNGVFKAENYDVLVDSPIEIGKHDIYTFKLGKTLYEIAIYGKTEFNHDEIVAGIKKVVIETNKIFNDVPIEKYTFLIQNLTRGSGGLEHANSTSLQVSRWRYKSKDSFYGLVAHEYFHLWNAKRIIPLALTSFDYDKENYTKSLWVSEGVTSYYQNLILLNAEIIDIQLFLNKTQSSINYIESQPGIEFQSLAESSFDAWIKQYQPNENSQNSTVSYYSKGKIVALILDLEIIKSSNAEKNLDDVLKILYDEYYKKKNRGFSESELIQACSSAAGKDMSDFFKKYVYGTEPIDYQQFFGYCGIDAKDSYPNYLEFGANVMNENGRLMVKSVKKGGSAFKGGLNVNDEIIAVNGYRVTTEELNSIIQTKSEGDTISVLIARDGLIQELPIGMQKTSSRNISLSAIRELSKEERKIFKKWIRVNDES